MNKNGLGVIIILCFSVILGGCGFHLRGYDNDYQFPYRTMYLDCQTPIICSSLRRTITAERLTKLVNKRESAEVTLLVDNEQTSRDISNLNGVGQIASYLLTYQVTAQLYDRNGDLLANDMVIQSQSTMAFNNSLILSAQQQEDRIWNRIHQDNINSLIRRIVYTKPVLVSQDNATKSN
jgi:LPS-assembly lipoprotein